MNPEPSSDSSLLRQFEAGDQGAASELFLRHAPKLFSVAQQRLSAVLQARVDADDIVQSTFKSFFRRATKGGYSVPKTGDLFNLLIVIAMRKVNAKADFHRAASRDARRTAAVDDEAFLARAADEAALNELCLTIDELLEEFSDIQSRIIRLRLEGHSVQEISESCQRSKRTVERELQAFRIRLSEEFEP
jgi:RNA polymerase sigma-70 factor (ECF subfamily)